MTIVLAKIVLAQSAFHQALQRRLQTQATFYAEEIIVDACHQFIATPKTFKRHGSFVPGPLESRRRLGKRRLVYALESMPGDKLDSWSWWRYFQQFDHAEWKWEPPRSISMNQEPKSNSSQFSPGAWLLSIFKISKQVATSSCMIKLENSSNELLQEELTKVRAAIIEGSEAKVIKACRILNHTFSSFLRQGMLSEMKIVQLLDEVSKELIENLSPTDLAANLCCSFYQSAWDGINAFKSSTFDPAMDQATIAILQGLSKLPISLNVQDLVSFIIQSTSDIDIKKVPIEALQNIFISWALSWREDLFQIDLVDCHPLYLGTIYEKKFAAAKEIMLKIEREISDINTQLHKDKSSFDIKISILKSKFNILSGLKAIERAEDFLIPELPSASNLAKTLNSIPRIIVIPLLHNCSRIICEMSHQIETPGIQRIQNYWLLSLSKMPSLNNKEFLNLWRYMDTHGNVLQNLYYPWLLINRWESNSSVGEQLHVRNTMETTKLYPNEDYGLWVSLVNAIYKCYSTESHFGRIGSLFVVLNALGKVDTVGNTILHLSEINPRLPAEILEYAVEILVDYKPEMAWKVAVLSRIMIPGRKYRSESFPKGDFRTIRFSYCPKFVNWMIKDSNMNPVYIWKFLRIWVHMRYSARYRNQPSSKPLPPKSEALIKNMAIAYAYSKRLSPRVAFRNVMWCWHHLRHHRTPIDKTMVKALVHSGILRCIENGSWVSESRQNWLCHLVEQVEGVEAAKEINQTVKAWNKRISLHKIWHRRESNVLRTGQID